MYYWEIGKTTHGVGNIFCITVVTQNILPCNAAVTTPCSAARVQGVRHMHCATPRNTAPHPATLHHTRTDCTPRPLHAAQAWLPFRTPRRRGQKAKPSPPNAHKLRPRNAPCMYKERSTRNPQPSVHGRPLHPGSLQPQQAWHAKQLKLPSLEPRCHLVDR